MSSTSTPETTPTNTHTCLLAIYLFSTWSYKTKVVHSGNGATLNTICSGGRPLVLPSSRLNCSQWQTYSLTPLSKQKKPMSTKLPGAARCCSNNPSIHWIVSLPLLWIQPVSLVFNYLSQYGYIELQHMSQIIKCIYKSWDAMAISEGQWKLHWWFAA